jgi:hypothetical protein
MSEEQIQKIPDAFLINDKNEIMPIKKESAYLILEKFLEDKND